MVNALGKMMTKPMEIRRPDTTGVLASKPNTNIFASANVAPPASIFGNGGGSAETSGACASSGGGGSSTLAVA